MVLLFNISNGLIVGMFYALMALGLALILMLNNVVNFAHGGFMTLGAYLAFTIEQHFGFWAGLWSRRSWSARSACSASAG